MKNLKQSKTEHKQKDRSLKKEQGGRAPQPTDGGRGGTGKVVMKYICQTRAPF